MSILADIVANHHVDLFDLTGPKIYFRHVPSPEPAPCAKV